MEKIDKEQGLFVTIVPKSRKEVHEFYHQCYEGRIRWKNLTWFPSSRNKRIQDVFHVSTGHHQLMEGYKMFWYKSSIKKAYDKASREQRITAASGKLEMINEIKKRGPKTKKGFESLANKILNRFKVGQWISIEVKMDEKEEFFQESRGRANSRTKYFRKVKKIPHLIIKKNLDAIAFSESYDGVFPLVTNTKMDALQTLKAYRYQPKIEKRFSYMKSDYQIAPVFLKKTERIEALMFLCFFSDLVAAIIVRELEISMKKSGFDKLQILPEERATKSPTWEQIQRLFEHQYKNELIEKETGVLLQTFWDDMTRHQKKVIELMGIPMSIYGN